MNEKQKIVNDLVERIERHQSALKLNDSRFVARYQRHLGSVDSWRRGLVARDWDRLGKGLDRWLEKLRKFVAELDGQVALRDFVDALPIARYGAHLYDALQDQQNDRRVGWLIGPTGVGKSWTMAKIKEANPDSTVYLHVNRGAKDSMMVLATMLARTVGATSAHSAAATYQNVVEALIAHPMTVIIDDVHDGGLLILKLLKHLVDDSRVKLILGTYPTGWNALVNGSTDAHAEAQQLLGRSLKPVNTSWIKGLRPDDVASLLAATTNGTKDEVRVVAARLAPWLQRHGNLRALADSVELARINADESGGEVTPELVEEALGVICPK